MKKKWKHLSVFDRAIIEIKNKEGMSVSDIAKYLKRDKGTISRELKRKVGKKYGSEAVHQKALSNRKKRGKRNLLKNEFIKDYVEIALMEENWTPELISLRIEIDTPFSISHETIYQYIYSKDANKNLRKYLPFRHRQRHRKGYRKVQKLERLNSLPSIELRPKIVDERVEIGHFEDDSIVSRKSDERIKSVNERVTGIVFFTKVSNGTSAISNQATINSLQNFPPEYLKSLTRDRGTENYGYECIRDKLKNNIYFAHPYCSHERGSNENLNGLFRRYFPKGTDFSKVTVEQIRYVEMKINNRPRKRFGGLTPVEVLFKRTGVAITY